MEVYNIWGLLVHKTLIQSVDEGQLFVNTIPSGSYVALVHDNRNLLIKKNIVITK